MFQKTNATKTHPRSRPCHLFFNLPTKTFCWQIEICPGMVSHNSAERSIFPFKSFSPISLKEYFSFIFYLLLLALLPEVDR